MKRVARSLAFGFPLLVPAVASAHVVLVDPPPRSGDNDLVALPCGDAPPGDTPTEYMAGETITVQWTLGQSHGGTVRIDLAEADDMGFREHVLAMDVSDAEGEPTSIDVTLPDVDCEACTLRITQVNPEEDDYVSCADIRLSGASAGSTGGGDTTGDGGDTTGDGGGTTGGGGGGSDTGPLGDESADDAGDDAADDAPPGDDGGTTMGGDTTTGESADDDDTGGCGCRTRGPAGSAWLVLLGLVAVRRRRLPGSIP